MDITTVAAGGGSRLFFRSGLFAVGPESSGAHPGPVCYRKGGFLSITDANLYLGRIIPDFFPKIFGLKENEPLDEVATQVAFKELATEINKYYESIHQNPISLDEMVYGFIKVANEAMCRPIRSITEAKGYDASTHVLACFGGAGAQHACAIARTLGMKKVFIHRFAGVLSAYGLGLADVIVESQVMNKPKNNHKLIFFLKKKSPCALQYSSETLKSVEIEIAKLCEETKTKLLLQKFREEDIRFNIYLNLRYEGTDTSVMTLRPEDGDYKATFIREYRREYGFTIEGRPLIIDDIRVRAIANSSRIQVQTINKSDKLPNPVAYSKCYFEVDENYSC